MSILYLFNLFFQQAGIGHVQLRGKIQERKQDLVGLQGDDTSENQQQEINLRIATTLRPLLQSLIPLRLMFSASYVAPNEELRDMG